MQQRILTVGLVAAALAAPIAASAQQPPPIDQQLEQYWGHDRVVHNVERRLFQKEDRFEGSIGAGVIPNDPYFMFYPITLKVDWYPIEDLALEFGGLYAIGSKSDLETFVETELRDGQEGLLPERMEWNVSFGVLWTPLQGKLGIFDANMGHFDLGLAAGLAVIGNQLGKSSGGGDATSADINYIDRVITATGDGSDDVGKDERRMDFGGYLGATLRYYVVDWFAVRVDYRHFMYQATKVRGGKEESNGLAAPAEISLGFSFFTPSL